jgi:hypothetical protein
MRGKAENLFVSLVSEFWNRYMREREREREICFRVFTSDLIGEREVIRVQLGMDGVWG